MSFYSIIIYDHGLFHLLSFSRPDVLNIHNNDCHNTGTMYKSFQNEATATDHSILQVLNSNSDQKSYQPEYRHTLRRDNQLQARKYNYHLVLLSNIR